jgi:putative PIN family toxin of toxin-antitoxin system
MKILHDTNDHFAAFATRGLTQAVFELCLERHTIITSESILSELAAHLQKKLKMPDKTVGLIIDYFKGSCLLGQESPVKKGACRDEEDLHILGLAVNVEADFIITGDSDLLVLRKFRKTSIITPREFWEIERKKRDQ